MIVYPLHRFVFVFAFRLHIATQDISRLASCFLCIYGHQAMDVTAACQVVVVAQSKITIKMIASCLPH
jgi:hypothetical protein